jgi:hypothetical protein
VGYPLKPTCKLDGSAKATCIEIKKIIKTKAKVKDLANDFNFKYLGIEN